MIRKIYKIKATLCWFRFLFFLNIVRFAVLSVAPCSVLLRGITDSTHCKLIKSILCGGAAEYVDKYIVFCKGFVYCEY